eukprot:1404338-Prymnesium_polylepis.1
MAPPCRSVEVDRMIELLPSRAKLPPAKTATAPPDWTAVELMTNVLWLIVNLPPLTSATPAPPGLLELATVQLLITTSEPFRIVPKEPPLSERPLARISKLKTEDRCCASSVAPSPSEAICRLISPTAIPAPLSKNKLPGAMKSASEPNLGTLSIASCICAGVGTASKPVGPGMSGGSGGGEGGEGAAGGTAGSPEQPGTVTPNLMQVSGHKSCIAEASEMGGVKGNGQPALLASVLNSAMLIWHADATSHPIEADANIPCGQLMSPAQMAMLANAPAASLHPPAKAPPAPLAGTSLPSLGGSAPA